MIKCVVFDMDGLLVDSEPSWYRARSDLFQANGLTWTDADQIQTMGVNTAEWAGYMAGRLGNQMSTSQVVEEMVSLMESYYRADVPLTPGAREIVELLSRCYPVGLASGSHPRLIQAALAGAGWTEVFAKIVSGDEVERGKPAPDSYFEISRRMGVAAREMVVFEDSAYGILAGRAAGAKVIAVPNALIRPAADVLDQSDLIIESLEDFRLELLDDL